MATRRPNENGLFVMQLDDGHRVTVRALDFDLAYGARPPRQPSSEADERARRAFLHQLARQWGPRPVAVLDDEAPATPGLPRVACAAWLSADAFDESSLGSELVVAWWQDSVSGPLPRQVLAHVHALPWTCLARNYEA